MAIMNQFFTSCLACSIEEEGLECTSSSNIAALQITSYCLCDHTQYNNVKLCDVRVELKHLHHAPQYQIDAALDLIISHIISESYR